MNNFWTKHKQLHADLQAMARWNRFAASLLQHAEERASLSPKQLEAAYNMTQPIDLSNVAELFRGVDLEQPKLQLQAGEDKPVVLTLADAQSPYAGYINVSDGKNFGAWYGRVSPGGEAQLKHDIPADVRALLENLSPETLKVQGQHIGRCCCCGAELTDPVSIENGIGPVCAERWGVS